MKALTLERRAEAHSRAAAAEANAGRYENAGRHMRASYLLHQAEVFAFVRMEPIARPLKAKARHVLEEIVRERKAKGAARC